MLLNISHSLLGMTHFIRIGSPSLLVPYRSSLSAFKATSGNLYATHQALYRQPLVCNASRSRGARKGETSTTWEMKPTWDLPRGGTFDSWGRGRGRVGVFILPAFQEESLSPGKVPGIERRDGMVLPKPPSLHPRQAAQQGHCSAFAWMGVTLSISVLIEASTCSLVPLCRGWYQKLRAQG